MISAQEARQNVINKEFADYRIVETTVMEVLTEMDAAIQFHSQHGMTEIDFFPYTNSHFPSAHFMELAKDIFDRVLKRNGYTITVNNIETNVLKVQW